MMGLHVPATHASPASHPEGPEHGCRATLVTHCAMWLPLPRSWNGSQKAGPVGSSPAFAFAGSNATIQICAWVPAAMRSPYARRLENVSHMSFPPLYVCTSGTHLGHESPPVDAVVSFT